MLVLRKTMEAAVTAERESASKTLGSYIQKIGAALHQSNELARQLLAFKSGGSAGKITPKEMAQVFWSWDDAEQAEFFNSLQDVVAESLALEARPTYAAGVPAGEGQWWHMAKLLTESGRETIAAMQDHALHHAEAS